MPVYEYRCGKCGREFELWQRITDGATAKCSVCGGKASRLISQTSFMLKGSGWYATDYARSSSAKGAAAPAAKDAASKDNGAATKDKGKETSSPSGKKSSSPGEVRAQP